MAKDKPSDTYTTESASGDIYIDETWWNAHLKGHESHEFLVGHIRHMRDRQATRYQNMRKLISIFEWGYKASTYDGAEEAMVLDNLNAYNAAQNVVETVHASVTKTTIIPMPLTTGGGYLQRKRAKDLQKALEGEYHENDMDRVQDDVVLDALVCGTGFCKVFSEFGRVRIEHVPSEDILVDDSEGRYRKPPSIYQTTRMDRFKALELYGGSESWLHGDQEERRKRILNCTVSDSRDLAGLNKTNTDQIDVYEAYHLPSGPDSKDGRWVVAINGCTLVSVERDRKRFPFAAYVPRPRRRSFWGLSMMHDLACNQNEYERITRKIQKAHQKMGGSHIIASRQAQISEREIDNDQGTFFEFDGPNPPMVFNPDPVNAQTYAYQMGIPETMMRSRGVSPMSGAGEVPAGLRQASGKALQVLRDEQGGRLKPYFKELDRWHVEVCQLIIDEVRELVANDGTYSVRYPSKKALEKVDWAKVIVDEDDFILKIFPISALSQDPAGKFEQLQEMLNAGAISVEQFKRLFGLPDLEAENEIDTADTDIVDMLLDKMVIEGKYFPPQPFDNLELAKTRAGKFYNLCRANDVAEERLALLQNFILDCQAEIERAQGQAAPPPGAMPPPMGPPPGPPGMPPGPPMPPDMMPPPGGMPPPMAA